MYLQIAMNRILKKKSEKNQPKYVIMELFEAFSDDYIECKHINDILKNLPVSEDVLKEQSKHSKYETSCKKELNHRKED